ncbi:MAG: GntR family transcriptional regulator [Ruminococcaceae bacterium]|nr:GntR family transcriptional regulator [Oscillospiraceae bacterium]
MVKKETESESKSLYLQIKNDILELYGDKDYFFSLPSERELCEKFDVSRSTIRKAMDLLEADGKIIRMRGKGAFFTGNQADSCHRLHSGIGFYNDELDQGKITKSKVLLQNVEHASSQIAEKLGIAQDDDVFHLLRLRFIDDQPVTLTESYIPLYISPDLIKIDFTDKSLYNTFREHGINPDVEYQAIEVRPANAYQAMHLQIDPGDPLMILFALAHDSDNRIIEYVTTKVPAYKTRFEFNRDAHTR